MTSAPCSKGGTRQGVAVVLSTTSDTPWRCAMSASFYQNDQTTWLTPGILQFCVREDAHLQDLLT